MILFLDIDGVLHSNTATQETAFCNRHHLWRLLLAFSNMKVVISSDWRISTSLEELNDLIMNGSAPSLKERIISITPVMSEFKYDFGNREKECLAWLDQNNQTNWLAIDDVIENFEINSKNVYITNFKTGLTSEDVDVLIKKIKKLNYIEK